MHGSNHAINSGIGRPDSFNQNGISATPPTFTCDWYVRTYIAQDGSGAMIIEQV